MTFKLPILPNGWYWNAVDASSIRGWGEQEFYISASNTTGTKIGRHVTVNITRDSESAIEELFKYVAKKLVEDIKSHSSPSPVLERVMAEFAKAPRPVV